LLDSLLQEILSGNRLSKNSSSSTGNPNPDASMAAVRSVDAAEESFFAVDKKNGEDIKLWYRTWGNPAGIPVLFVHGGPGNCVADYDNPAFFDADKFFVVEIDQRGTGKSLPSVRDQTKTSSGVTQGVLNMKLYQDITIVQMSADFEKIREHLKIKKWLVFGGSWGSTLGLDYAERYPRSCIALIVRGIFLSIREELEAVFALEKIEELARNLRVDRYVKEFNIFFEYAKQEFERTKGSASKTPLDPHDYKKILYLYENMILQGDRMAIWKWYVYEVNLVEEDPSDWLDPETIDESKFEEAQSVAFFEARLFLNGVYELSRDQLDLLEDTKKLTETGGSAPYHVPVWVVQGTGDAVCPDKFAHMLVDKLKNAGVLMAAHFVDAGHKASSDGIKKQLQVVVKEFYELYTKKGLPLKAC